MQRTTRLLPAKSCIDHMQLEPARKRTARNALFFRSERVPWPTTSALRAGAVRRSPAGCRHITVRHERPKYRIDCIVDQ